MVALHIIAGGIGLLAGAIALAASKGGTWHRRGGRAFVVAMCAMAGSGALIAGYIRPNIGSMGMGLLTFYLVVTGWMTVRFPVAAVRAPLVAGMLSAFAVGAFLIHLGLIASNNTSGRIEQLPPQPMYVFGSVALIGALLDARLLHAGDIVGKHRLARHLWRLGTAMFIATTSFFIGQARQFPLPIRQSGVLMIPVLLVVLVLGYWLVKLFWKRNMRVLAPDGGRAVA